MTINSTLMSKIIYCICFTECL